MFAKTFIDRPVLAIVLAILTLTAGVVALKGLPIAEYPDIVPPEVLVSANYTGADALTIEQSVATPLEQQVNGVDKMLYLRSTNGNDGTMSLKVTFEVGTDPDANQVQVQNRVSQASANLPPSVNQYGVTVKKAMGSALLVAAVYSPRGTRDGTFLGNYASINLMDVMLRVPGVGQVTNFGASDYAMRIWVKPDQIARLNLTVQDLIAAVQRQNSVNPSGRVGAEPAPKGQEFTYTVRAQGRLETAQEFAAIVVRTNPDGSTVHLGDVARLELGGLAYMQVGRFNQKPAAILVAYQAPGSNSLAVAKGLKKALADAKAQFPDDVDYEVSLDATQPVTAGIHDILRTLMEAVVLVLLVVFLFLQNWRATLIPLIAVPVSLVGTFVMFPLLGFSINTLSLFGLVLAIGLVVDDAIVVVEAVEHHIEHGLAPREATLKAMEEVSGPVVGIALILSAVFVPVAFMGGIVGRLNQQFAITIAISVIISAFNALTLSPALAALLLRPRRPGQGWIARFFAAFNRGFERLTGRYVGLTGHLVRKSARTLAGMVALFALAAFMGLKLPSGFVPQEDAGYFFLDVQLPDAASLQRTDEVCRQIDGILAQDPDVQYTTTVAGFSLLSGTSATYTAFYFVSLRPWEARKGAAHSHLGVMERLNRTLALKVPQAVAFAFPPPAIPGVGAAGGVSMVLQDRRGESVDFLARNTDRFIAAARKRPEIASIANLWRASVPQVFARVNKEQALKQGVDVAEVYATLQANLGGAYVNQFNRFGRQWKVMLQAEPEYRLRAEDLAQYYVRNDHGAMVPLGAFVATERIFGPESTIRHNLFRSVEITVNAAPGYSSGQVIAALEAVAREVLPREIGHEWSGMTYQERKATGGAGVIFALSFFVVFLILAAMYESWSLPFSVLLSAPLAMLGAYLGLMLRGFPNNVYAQIGLVMLIGLAAKNAILIVEFAKLEHEKGRDFADAALEGARLRLRPILMTSFAFILGVVPLVLATGAGAEGRKIMGTAVFMGMSIVTALGIFLVPVLYVAVERFFRSGKGPAAPPAPGA